MIRIPNGIELNGAVKRSVFSKKELGFEKKHKIVGSVGRLWRQKAPQYFIEAIPEVIKKHPDARFVLTGDGPLEKELQDLAKRLGVAKYVHFLGWRKDAKQIKWQMTNQKRRKPKSVDLGYAISVPQSPEACRSVIGTTAEQEQEIKQLHDRRDSGRDIRQSRRVQNRADAAGFFTRDDHPRISESLFRAR